MSRRFSGILLYLMLFFLPTEALSAQTNAGSSDQPTFKAITREVVVDVVVTEGKGEAVNGLRKGTVPGLRGRQAADPDFL
jgi:hypothetical protein